MQNLVALGFMARYGEISIQRANHTIKGGNSKCIYIRIMPLFHLRFFYCLSSTLQPSVGTHMCCSCVLSKLFSISIMFGTTCIFCKINSLLKSLVFTNSGNQHFLLFPFSASSLACGSFCTNIELCYVQMFRM